MPTNRQDAWTPDEDLLLAEVVLRHIREGSTQLEAFEEVGKQLSRTAAACGFRWNSYVRKKYKTGIELAKKQRKERKQQLVKSEKFPQSTSTLMNDEEIISFDELIRHFRKIYDKLGQTKEEVEKASENEQKINQLEEKITSLTHENEKLKKELQMIEDDYKALIEIMERARKMVVLQEEDRQQKVKFQMDKNGNLERVEK